MEVQLLALRVEYAVGESPSQAHTLGKEKEMDVSFGKLTVRLGKGIFTETWALPLAIECWNWKARQFNIQVLCFQVWLSWFKKKEEKCP